MPLPLPCASRTCTFFVSQTSLLLSANSQPRKFLEAASSHDKYPTQWCTSFQHLWWKNQTYFFQINAMTGCLNFCGYLRMLDINSLGSSTTISCFSNWNHLISSDGFCYTIPLLLKSWKLQHRQVHTGVQRWNSTAIHRISGNVISCLEAGWRVVTCGPSWHGFIPSEKIGNTAPYSFLPAKCPTFFGILWYSCCPWHFFLPITPSNREKKQHW